MMQKERSMGEFDNFDEVMANRNLDNDIEMDDGVQ